MKYHLFILLSFLAPPLTFAAPSPLTTALDLTTSLLPRTSKLSLELGTIRTNVGLEDNGTHYNNVYQALQRLQLHRLRLEPLHLRHLPGLGRSPPSKRPFLPAA